MYEKSKFFKDYVLNYFSSRNTVSNVFHFLTIIVSLQTIVHIMACVWIRVGIYELETENSWFHNNAEYFETINMDFTELNHENPEVPEDGTDREDVYTDDVEIYLITWYFMCTTLTQVGYGDITPNKGSAVEMLIITIMQVASIYFFTSI